MVAIVRVTGSGQITIPAEMRRKLNIEKGDQVVVSEDGPGELRLRRAYTVADLDGIFALKPGVVADPDFGNIIREATEEYVERVAAQMKDQRVPE